MKLDFGHLQTGELTNPESVRTGGIAVQKAFSFKLEKDLLRLKY